MSETLKIGAVARRTGLSVDAIRFYEKEGLLKVRLRTEGGFRLFQEKDIEDLLLIRSGQSLGFSLHEIRDLLAVRSGVTTCCAQVKDLLERKLLTVQRQIGELVAMEGEILGALNECNETLSTTSVAKCPVLDGKRDRVAHEG